MHRFTPFIAYHGTPIAVSYPDGKLVVTTVNSPANNFQFSPSVLGLILIPT